MTKLIKGRPLIGFWGIFEECYGDASTESSMWTITPSFVGRSLLPFRCPRCERVAQDLACPVTREHYHDKREGRDNHFCPHCGCRFRINMDGMPLPSPIPAGAEAGPSIARRGDETVRQDFESTIKTVLGFLIPKTTNGWIALAKSI